MHKILLSLCLTLSLLTCAVPVGIATPTVSAQVFDGPGLEGGLEHAEDIKGPVNGNLRSAVVRLLKAVLSFVALIAVIMIIIAGLYLITGQGSDDSKTKAKNIIIYTIVGLVVIMLSRFIVEVVLVYLPSFLT